MPSHAGSLDSQRFRQRLQLPLPLHSFSQNREPARTGPQGSGTVNCQHCHGRGDASAYAEVDRPAEPYTGCHSRAGVCNGGTDKHTKGDRDGASPHKTRSRRLILKKEDSRGPVENFFRSRFPPRPTQTPSADRRGRYELRILQSY